MKLDPEIEYTAWHKLQKQIMFYIYSNTTTLSLGDLPIHAKEIKAHLYLQSGTAAVSRHTSWTFQTLFDVAKIKANPYSEQNAVSFCNEVITLQLDGRGFIEVIRDGVYPERNFGFTFEILSYR